MRIALAVAIASFSLAVACGLPDVPSRPDPRDAVEPPPDADPFQPKDNHVPGEADAPGFAIFEVAPDRGPIAGGTRVEVKGAGFLPGSVVVFDGSEGVETVVANDGSMSTTTPPHPAGLVAVSVRRPDGKTTRLDAAFLYETEVAVASVEPAAGPTHGGTPVTVRGTGFVPGTGLVFGGRLAVTAHVLDPRTIIAVTPPGDAGPRDVMVFGPIGAAVLKKGFHYVRPPIVESCAPAVVLAGTTADVVVAGADLSEAPVVTVSSGTAEVLSASGSEIVLRLSSAAPGPLDVALTTPGGTSFRPSCVAVVKAGDLAAPGPGILGVVPASGPVGGGTEVRVVASALPASPTDVSLSFGGTPADVTDVTNGVVRARTPAHAPGVVDVDLQVPAGQARAKGAFEYLPVPELLAVSPNFGPPSGGTVVTLSGTSLERLAEVRVGPLPASIISGPTAGSVTVVTAPGNPGVHDVVATTDEGIEAVLPAAFTYGATDPGLVAVSPNTGAIAGGTLVAVVGSGFGPGVEVLFAGRPAAVASSNDPARLLVRTPAGVPGPADVEVRWPGGHAERLERAYTYFDPTGYFGGIWGDPIDQSVNVTVLDGYNGKPIYGAFVVLGSDPGTPWKGLTDLNGQVTFSATDLFGPVQVTAARADYSTFTFSGVESENVTIFLDSIIPSSSGGGSTGKPPLPPGTVTGHVVGVDKYVLAPPASCADRPLVHGKLCAPCLEDADCGDGGRCLDPSGLGRYCAIDCESAADCPEGYDCFGISMTRPACLPSIGRGEVRCGIASTGMYSSGVDPGPGAVADEHQAYALNSRLGDVAVWCLGGVRRFDDGEFEPLVLGLLRHVSVYPATVTADRDVRLDIPLDREVEVRLLNAPGGPGGANVHSLGVAVDLGSDGVLRLWPAATGIDRDRFVIPHFPRSFTGPLADAVVLFQGEAETGDEDGMPYSVSIVRDWVPGRGNQVLRVDAAGVTALDPDVRPDGVAGCGRPGGGGIVLGTGGRTYEVDASGAVTLAPSLATRTLRACTVAADGTVYAVGDHGLIVRANGTAVEREVAPTSATLRAVAEGGGTVWVAGDGVLLRRSQAEGAWSRIDYGSLAPLHAIAAAPDGVRAVAVGAGGIAVTVVGDLAGQVLPWPSDRDLLAATPYGDGLLAVGVRGAAYLGRFDGTFERLPGAPEADLRAVIRLPDGSATAAGAAGTFARLSGRSWSAVPAPGFDGEVTTLLPGSAGAALAISSDTVLVGPFLDVPRFTSPPRVLPWLDLTVTWSRSYPPYPSVTFTRLSGSKGAGPWNITANGRIESITLPDLQAMAGLDALPSGDIRVYATHALIDDFRFTAFDEDARYMSSWRSFTVEQYVTRRP